MSSQSVVTLTEHQAASDLIDEAVILNLDSGVYYGLNPVGTRLWKLLEQPRSVQALCDAILAEYDVDADTCMKDVLAVLRDLRDAGLVEIEDARSD